MKIKDVFQRVDVDATPLSPVDSVWIRISLDVTLGGDHVALLDVEQVDLFTTKGAKLNPWKWVKKRGSQVGELDQLKLKIVALHGDYDEEVHMTQLFGFIDAKSISVG